MEHFERGGDEYRGANGPLWISDPVVKEKSSYDFIEAANRIGIPVTEDMNGALHDGVGFMQHNIQDGQRMSTYRAFIEPVIERPNLTVRTGCELQRVLFEGRTAVGIEVLKSGRLERIYAAREVILSAGSLKTPQMLMLSGIGPRAELEKNTQFPKF
ncbi:GMC family oxidoreductase N-terminal domain-containing protein [Pseudomonas lini]